MFTGMIVWIPRKIPCRFLLEEWSQHIRPPHSVERVFCKNEESGFWGKYPCQKGWMRPRFDQRGEWSQSFGGWLCEFLERFRVGFCSRIGHRTFVLQLLQKEACAKMRSQVLGKISLWEGLGCVLASLRVLSPPLRYRAGNDPNPTKSSARWPNEANLFWEI